MNRLQQLFHAARNDEQRPDCYKRVRYIRDCCKTFSDLYKNEKDLFNRNIDGDLSKSFKEFRQSEVGKDYRFVDGFSSSINGNNSSVSILNQIIDDLIEIHDYLDARRRTTTESIKRLIELAREKQSNIRQTINDLRDNYEKAERKLEIADSNLKKFQLRPDRLSINNYTDKCREFEETRFECELNRTLTRDLYQSEIYQFANEEYSITMNIFYQYLLEQNQFYQDVSKYFSSKMPVVQSHLNENRFIPIFGCDLIDHCSKRTGTRIAYPIEICIRLMENNFKEEGIFRIASSQSKQKKFVNELNLQLIDKRQSLVELGYDIHVPANTLKQYLRELPNCLLTNELYSQWNQTTQISDEQTRLQRVEQLLNQLPDIHFDNLSYLLRFLVRITKYSQDNKMNPNNLSICIGSTILFPQDQQQMTNNQTLLSTNYTNGSIVLEFLINHYEYLFRTTRSSKSTTSINVNERNLTNQPDLIPTEFHSKIRVNQTNETSLENTTNVNQPSPVTRRKAKAPPPPPPPPLPSSSNIQIKQAFDQDKSNDSNDHDRHSNIIIISTDQTTSNSTIEQQTDRNKFSFKTLHQRFSTGLSSMETNININEKYARRPINSICLTDRPTGPPPLPPSSELSNNENTKIYENVSFIIDDSSSIEQNQDPSDEHQSNRSTLIKQFDQDQSTTTTTTTTTNKSKQHSSNPTISNQSFSVGQVIAQFNNRTSLLNSSTPKFKGNVDLSQSQRSSSSIGQQTTNNSPSETTNF